MTTSRQTPFIDCHSHAHFAAFKEDWREVIHRSLEQDVWVINVGTQRDTSTRAIEVAHAFKEGVYAIVGLHPTHTSKSYHDEKELGLPTNLSAKALATEEALAKEGDGVGLKGFTSRGEEFDYEYYKKLAEDPKVVAIGECGLDYYRQGTREQVLGIKEKQGKVFLEHVKLASEVRKPLMIHCRPSQGTDDAYEDLLSLVINHKLSVDVIFHFYVGSPTMTKKLVDLGAYFTFGGVITFARNYDESIKMVPQDRILSETDAPYVAPEPYRGKRNEPVYVIEVVKKLAELKNVSLDAMREQIFENAKKVFTL